MCSLFIGMVIITCFYYIVAGALLGGYYINQFNSSWYSGVV